MVVAEAKEKIAEGERLELEQIYESAFPIVARFVARMGGSFEEAQDVFHDALVIYCEETRHREVANPSAYLAGIARHIWARKFERKMKTVSLTDEAMSIDIPEKFFPTVEERRLLALLERAGRRCMEMLHAFYYQQMGMRALLTRFGFSSEHSAAVQKYKCIEKLRDEVNAKQLSYEDFFE